MSAGGEQRYTVTIGANMDPSGVLAGVKTMQNAFNGLKINPNLMSDITKEFGTLQKNLEDYRKILDKGVTSKNDLKNLQGLEKAIDASFSRLSKLQNELGNKTIITKVDSTQLDQLAAKTQVAKDNLAKAFSGIKIGNVEGDLNKVETSLEKAAGRSKVLKESFVDAFSNLKIGNVEQFASGIDNIFQNLNNKLRKGKLGTTADSILESFKKIGLINVDVKTETAAQKLLALKTGFDNLKNAIANGVQGDELKKLIQELEDATTAERKFEAEAQKRGQHSLEKEINETSRLKKEFIETSQAERQFQQQTLSATQQLEQLQQSTQYFFGLRNMINLLKQGMREAVQTIKDLDKAMTETAVVTRYSVGDMWSKLPEYTANANKLGATIQDMYESTTLYYQQGLNTQQSMAIASETMKMARIAGLEAKDATDMMTAALRGFNMELNEASATRINDVYSNLAAKTASNTEEIGKAMQRTASIAASAGMSFEGTAAFLAQAIETTREPAENIGTAMKTIVARFTELKKNPLEIADVEGEEVSYNKIDTALQSIGVSLKDTNGQFRDLDQVFLEISEKWDSLSQTQQRYIATTAAGSRQQSRFIAMMSNYDRTVELMSYANNSAGASQEQFGKTLESLEAKINKFQNAWKEFLMGILNDTWTKRFVDAGTTVLNTVNSIINALSFNGKLSLLKSALSIFTGFTALKFTGRFANKMIGGLGGMIDPTSSFGLGFKSGGVKTGGGQAKAISDPIVQAVNRIYNILNKNAVDKETLKSRESGKDYFNQYKNQQSAFKQAVKSGGTVGQAFGAFNNLDKRQISTILNNNVGMERQLQKTFKGYVDNLPISTYTQQLVKKSIPGMFKAFKNDPKMSGDDFLKTFGIDKLGKTLIAAGNVKAGQEILNANRMGFATQNRQTWLEQKGITAEEHAAKLNKATRDEAYYNEYKAYKQQYRQQRQSGALALPNLSNQKIVDPSTLDRIAQGVGAVGSAFSTAGMAVSSFGMALSSCGLETLGGILTKVGSGISSVGTLISSVGMTLASIASATGAAITSLLGPLAAIAGAIIAIIAVAVLLDKAIVTNKERLEMAADAATAASEAFDSAKQSASELTDALERIRETQASFDGLVAGTTQFNEQLVTANQQILDLIDKYPMLMEAGKDYVTTDKNGLMHINEAGLKAVEEYQKSILAQASAMSLIQNADLNILEAEQKAKELRKEKSSLTEKEYQQNLRNADLLEQQADIQQKMARQNAIQTVLTDKNVKNNQKLAGIYVDQYEAKRAEVEASISTDKHDLRQKYADYYGYTYERATKKMTDMSGNEINYDDTAIKDEVIEATVLLEFQADAPSLESTLSGIDSAFAASIEDNFQNKATFITDLLTKNIETDEDLLREVLIDQQHFEDLVSNLTNEQIAAILGVNAEAITDANINQYKQEIVDKLTKNGQDIADAQSEAYANLGVMLAKTAGYSIDELDDVILRDGRDRITNMDVVSGQLQQLTSKQTHELANIGAKIEKEVGADAMQEYIGHMVDLYTQTNRSKFGNIDLSNRENWFNKDGSISTVSGTSGEFGVDGKIGIAFTPYLQTGTGTPKKLTPQEYNKYLEDIVEQAKGNKDEILRLDKEKYGIIADVSEDATKDKGYIDVAKNMHNLEELRMGAQEIQGIMNKADFSSALGQLKTYNKLTKGTYKTTQELGKSLSSLPSSANLVGKAFNEFLDSSEWSDLEQNIDSIQDSFGNIDSAGIMSAAESSDYLNTLLEAGQVSAGGLAMALQGFVDGKYAIDAVNQTVLQLLSSFTRVEDAALEAHNIIENFDPGIDYGEASDFVQDNAKKVQEFLDKGAYGNPQLQNYIKLATGEDLWNETLKRKDFDLEETTKALSKYVTKFKDGFDPVIDDLLNNQGINGKSLADNINKAVKDGELDKTIADKFKTAMPRMEGDNFVFGPDGSAATDFTTDELILYLEKAYGVSSEYAHLIFEEWANLSPDLKAELAKNDFIATLTSPEFQETHVNEAGQYIFSDSEIQTYAAARGLKFGEALGEIADQIEGIDIRDLENSLMRWSDTSGERFSITGDNANKQVFEDYVQKFFNTTGEKLLDSSAYNKDDKIELSQVMSDAVARGADNKQAAEIAWTAAQEYGGTGQFYYEGQLINMEDFANFDEFYDHLNQLQETSQWVEIGRAIAQGMEEYQQNKGSKNGSSDDKSGSGDKKEDKPKDTSTDRPEVVKPGQTKTPVGAQTDTGIKGAANKNKYTYDPNLSMVDKGKPGRELTSQDKIPGWIAPVFQKIGEHAQKQTEIQEAYKNNIHEQNKEDSVQQNIDWWKNILTTNYNDKHGYGTDSTSSTQTDQTSTGSEDLTQAATQLTTGVESLSSAGENLNTAATNLNAAAVLLGQSGQTSGQPQSSTQGPPAPSATVNNANASIVIDAATAQQTLDDLNAKVDEVQANISEETTFNIGVNDSGLAAAGKNAEKITSAAKGENNISVSTGAVDTQSIEDAKSAIATDSAELPVKALDKTAEGLKTIKSNIKASPATLYVNVKPKGSTSITVTASVAAAMGLNNYIPYRSAPSFGSVAKGKYGQLGPKGKGGLTLTGEEGYEIAWLPSENRSMVLGTKGPQMVNLPKDAVVYTHEQSEDIIKKRQTIEAGSHFRISRPGGASTSTGYAGGKHSTGKKGGSSSGSKKKNYNNWSIEEVIRFDVNQNLERLVSELARITDEIETDLTKIGTTANKISGTINAQLENLEATLKYNEDLNASYQRQLDELLNATTANYQVSYTQANGKSANKLINPADYIFQNAAGTYEIDVDAIKKLATGKNGNTDRALEESVFNEVSKILNELQSGLSKTADEIFKIQKEMREAGEKVSEAFYQWENELTEIYDLSQRIANETSLTDRFTSQIDLELAKMNAGFGTAKNRIEDIQKILARSNKTIQEQIKNQQQMISARKTELDAALNTIDEYERLQKYLADTTMDEATKAATVDWAKQQYMAAELGRKYITNLRENEDGSFEYEIDWAAFNAENSQDPYNKETYDAIKAYLDNLNDSATEYNNSIKDQTDFIKQTYDSLLEYQNYVVDFEDTLISSVEDQIRNATQNAKQISDSVTNALKNLLDEVKRKLDERRRQEDNAKTERDISQKQQRLAALRADTAGGHQVEIAQLEKEIADAQQSYQRTLEDQLLDKLQQQADEAAKQREHQIELAEASNEIASAINKELVDSWLHNPEQFAEEMKTAWLKFQGFDEKGEAGQAALLQQWEGVYSQLLTAVQQSGFNNEEIFKPLLDENGEIKKDTGTLVNLLAQLQETEQELLRLNTGTETTDVTTTKPTVQQLHDSEVDAMSAEKLGYKLEELMKVYSLSELHDSGYSVGQLKNADSSLTADKLKEVGYGVGELFNNFDLKDLLKLFTVSELKQGGAQIEDFAQAQVGYSDIASLFTDEELLNSNYAEDIKNDKQAQYDKFIKTHGSAYNKKSNPEGGKLTAAQLKEQIARGQILGKTPYGVAKELADTKALSWVKVMAALKGAGYTGKTVKSWDPNAGPKSAFYKAFVKKYGKWNKFEKGGLANFTGPAWLDGTPSKPELVLSATDTKNFLALRDVLSKAIGSADSASYGNAVYEININVDHLNNDYDVDKVAERVKKIIVKDSGYRNVTQVRNFR